MSSIETGGYSPERELESFIENKATPDTQGLMAEVGAKIRRSEDMMGEINKLDNELAGVDDEEVRAEILKRYLGDKKEDVEDGLDEGFGSDEEM